MEIYHTETQEDFDSLMFKLEKEGKTWEYRKKPADCARAWSFNKENTYIKVNNNLISFSYKNWNQVKNPEIQIKKYKAPSIKYKNDSVVLYPGRIFESDSVNSPKHYNSLKTEVIDTIEDVTEFYPKKIRYHIGNVIKYLFRAPFKNNIKEDLKKAQWYLQRAINKLEEADDN